MATATRKATWRSGPANGWHDDLIWYAAAINQMKLLTPRLAEFQTTFNQAFPQSFTNARVTKMASIAALWADPMSLGYQSQVHASFAASSTWPKYKGKKAIWHQCAHNHWFFIPWHRAYLLEFEAVVRAHIKALGGPADTWGLPYWNYSDFKADPTRLGLPAPLRGATLPAGVTVPGVAANADGTFPNPLFDPTRKMTGDPSPGTGTSWATATSALQRPHYANETDTGFISFGGGVLDRPNNAALFHQADESGELDRQPHGSVHNQVSGSMALFETAGLDPVFWLHHCNIDRLWETYAKTFSHKYPFQSGAAPANPAQQAWQTQKFSFLRPDKTVKVWTAPDVINVTALGYKYDSTTAPPLPPPPPPPPGSNVGPIALSAGAPPQPVAAARRVALTGDTVTALVPPKGTPAGQLAVAAFAPDARWVLRFTGIRSKGPALTSYDVYLGLPAAATADPDDPDHYVGLLSLFGVYEASRDDGTSSGAGRMRIFDVTPQLQALGGGFDVGTAAVRLVPLNPDREVAASKVSVEQITIEFA